MKKILFIPVVLLVVFQLLVSCNKKIEKSPVDYVNPNIGTIGHLLVATASIVQMPHGMVMAGQNPYPEIGDRYLADKISSFSLRALPRYATKTVPSWIMATGGGVKITSGERASAFDHDFETVTPYYSSVMLDDYQILQEVTVTDHASFYRFTFPESKESNILLGNNSEIKIISDRAVESVELLEKGQKAYFYAEFSRPFLSFTSW